MQTINNTLAFHLKPTVVLNMLVDCICLTLVPFRWNHDETVPGEGRSGCWSPS